MKKVGFIGVGIMGKSMVRNLMKHGFQVTIYARSREKAEDLLEEGAVWADSIGKCAKGQDVVITIVGFPADVEEVYFSEGGILANASQGSYLIDMTTTSPRLSKQIERAAKAKGLKALDAPVTGGDVGARAGTLTVLAGGDREDFEACLPVFQALGRDINYMGKSGSGQHAKMANQIAIAGALSGVCEAISYAKSTGLDPEAVIKAIGTGAAGSRQLDIYGPRILEGDMEPGFFVKHFVKDMRIAREEAEKAGVELGVLNYVLSMYEEIEKDGKGDLGNQCLIQYYEKQFNK